MNDIFDKLTNDTCGKERENSMRTVSSGPGC